MMPFGEKPVKQDENGEYYVPERSARVTFAIEPEIRLWLYREKRRRDRSMGWLINQALSQYMARIEKGLAKKNPDDR